MREPEHAEKAFQGCFFWDRFFRFSQCFKWLWTVTRRLFLSRIIYNGRVPFYEQPSSFLKKNIARLLPPFWPLPKSQLALKFFRMPILRFNSLKLPTLFL